MTILNTDMKRELDHLGRFLNMAWLRWIGVLSYSLYLWQQIFLSEHLHLLPYGYLYLLLAAAGSYWLVEQPLLRLRTRIDRNRLERIRTAARA